MDPDELAEVLENIAETMGDQDPEWAIHDYEWETDFELGDVHEMDSITDWNDLCNDAYSLEEWEAEEVAAAIEAYGYTFREALERHERGCFIFYQGRDLEEVAEEIIEECYDLPEFALRYFDYEAFARDLSFDGYTETKYGVICDN
jgi:antirestriction protein